MGIQTPLRQLARRAAGLKALTPPSVTPAVYTPLRIPRRYKWTDIFRGGRSATQDTNPDSFLQQYLKHKPKQSPVQQQPQIRPGGLTDDSIFEADRQREIATKQVAKQEEGEERKAKPMIRDELGRAVEWSEEIVAPYLDPAPEVRQKWQREQLLNQIRRRGRMTKEEMLLRTERQHLAKSPFYRTSTKKLGMLARQIAGKPIEEALVQMRFSKKRVAQDIKKHLEYARDSAIVARGMGLGKVEGKEGAPVQIETKEGKRMNIKDRTGIYIDQVWVGRGEYGFEPIHKARGRIEIGRPPTASLSILLKEEATRVRLHEEREAKRASRKTWVQLPDRPVTAQRQYYSW